MVWIALCKYWNEKKISFHDQLRFHFQWYNFTQRNLYTELLLSPQWLIQLNMQCLWRYPFHASQSSCQAFIINFWSSVISSGTYAILHAITQSHLRDCACHQWLMVHCLNNNIAWAGWQKWILQRPIAIYWWIWWTSYCWMADLSESQDCLCSEYIEPKLP